MSISTVDGFFRETGEVRIEIPALPRPALEQLQLERHWIQSIERDTSPTESVTLILGTVMRPAKERRISGRTYQDRIKPRLGVALGYQHARWLIEHQHEFPDLMALLNEVYIDFVGLVVVGEWDVRYYSYMERMGDKERFGLGWDWLFNYLLPAGRIAICDKHL
jgi:hypothetical protein